MPLDLVKKSEGSPLFSKHLHYPTCPVQMILKKSSMGKVHNSLHDRVFMGVVYSENTSSKAKS